MAAIKTTFWKMHGAGNDFVVLNGLHKFPFDLEQFVPSACDRHFGIGADGVIVLSPSKQADFAMAYFNADGSRTICGNGMRCLARFIFTQGLLPAEQRSFDLETDTGVVRVEVIGRGDRVRVDMGVPRFDGAQIPTSEPSEWIARSISVLGQDVVLTAVGMGNPHGVVFVDSLQDLEVARIGSALHSHALFPQKANIEFVQIIDRDSIAIEVFERGVGRTLACGTGICAAVAAGVREGRLERSVAVTMPGGEFAAAWSSATGRIQLTGPAQEVYRAEIDVEQAFGLKPLPLGTGTYPVQGV